MRPGQESDQQIIPIRGCCRITSGVYGSSKAAEQKRYSPIRHGWCEDAGVHVGVMLKINKIYAGYW
jgi:hypothetical protein